MKIFFSKKLRLLLLALFLWGLRGFGGAGSLFAQNPVQITAFNINAPYSNLLSDYISGFNQRVTLMMNATSKTDIRLAGSLKSNTGVSVTIPAQLNYFQRFQGQPISIQGQKRITAADIGNLFSSDPSVDNSTLALKRDLIGNYILPEGDYEVCLRAYQFGGSNALSDEVCAQFSIRNIEPPYLLLPQDKDTLQTATATYQPHQFSWTFPAGATPTQIEYVLQIAELREGQNPYNVFESGPLFAEVVVPNASPLYILKATDPRFELGHTYAWRVKVQGKGRFEGLVNFQNKGLSTVNVFTYGPVSNNLVTSSEKVVGAKKRADSSGVAFTPISGSCTCKIAVSTNTKLKTDLDNSQTVYIGNKDGYQLSISTLTKNGDTYSGDGTVALALDFTPTGRSGPFIPVQVAFKGAKINTDNILIAGQVQSKRRTDISFGPQLAADPTAPAPPALDKWLADAAKTGDLSAGWKTLADKINGEIKSYQQQAVQQANQQINGAGVATPFGYSSGVFTVAVDNLIFTPATAQYDAFSVLDINDANMSVPLGLMGACLPLAGCQSQPVLYLLKDTNIPYTAQTLTLKGGTDPANSTYLAYKANGNDNVLNIVADLSIPEATLVEGGAPVKARLVANTRDGFDNWQAKASIAGAFRFKGLADFTFKLGNGAVYDHDIDRNADGFEEALKALQSSLVADKVPNADTKLTLLSETTWQGFFMPELSITLPGVFQKTDGKTTAATSVTVRNMMLGKSLGLTGVLNAENVINYNEGSLDGWYFSLDKIGITFFDGTFVKANADGKIGLPISDNNVQSALAYTNTITSDGSGLKYEFKVVPDEDKGLNVPIWKANIKLASSSKINVTISGSTVDAKADLNGTISFKADLGGPIPDFNLDLMEVQHLQILSKAPYISVDKLESPIYDKAGNLYQKASDFAGKFASPQHSLGSSPTPISLDAFTPVMRDGKAGFYFHGSLDLADMPLSPKAGVGLLVLANVKMNGIRPSFSYDRTELEDVQVGGQLGPVKVNGSIKFFRDDKTFGNGFKGNLSTTFGGTSINGQAMFGRRDFAYWYFYLAGINKAGLFQVGPVTVNGIGGGLYHNMTPPKPDPNQFEDIAKTEGNYDYTPNQGTDGLKAALYFSVASQFVLNARATIEGSMTNGSLDQIRINGAGHLISDGDQKGILDAVVDARYHFPQKLFTLDAAVKGNLPLISMQGQLNALADFENGKYYVKVGEPAKRNTIAISGLGDLAKATGYFMVGNSDIPDIPPPSDDIISPETMSKFRAAGYRGFGLKPEGMPSGFEKAAGMAFGATLRVGIPDVDFLIFWAKLRAGAGFDVNIRQLPGAVCEETGGEIGYNGWYATGQAYFEFLGAVGVHAFLGDVKIIELKAAALLGAGLPNPTWFQGFLTGEGTFLGASLGFTLPVKVGDRCTIKTNPFEQRIIADMTPKDNDTNVDIMTNPEILLNYPRQFDVTYQDRNDNWRSHSYDLRPSVKLNGVLQPANQFYFPNEKSIVWNAPDAFDAPQKKITVAFAIDVFEDGKVFIDPNPKGTKKPVRDEMTARFTTGECRAALNPNDVAYTFPFSDQKYYLQNENSRGAIRLRKRIGCLTNDPSFEYYVLFKPKPLLGATLAGKLAAPVGNNNTSGVALTKTAVTDRLTGGSKADQTVLTGNDVLVAEANIEGNLISFDMPRLSNKTSYSIQLVKQLKQSALAGTRGLKQANMANLYVNSAEALAQVSTKTTISQDVSAKLSDLNRQGTIGIARNPATQQMEVQSKPFVLYDFAFSTSQFNTLTQKMNTVAATTTAQLNGDNTVQLSFSGQEGFDDFDLNGFDTGMPINGTNRTSFIEPLVRASESGNGWIDNVLGRDIQPKWRHVSTELRNAGVLMPETPRGNQSMERYYDIVTNQTNSFGYGEANGRNLRYVITRLSETIDDRILTMKENNQILFARATTFAQELNQQYRDRDNGCGLGTYRCPSDSYNNIRGELEKKYASWGGKMVGYIGENREQYGQDLRRQVTELMNWDARQSLCRSLPLTPTLTFRYRDVWEAGQSQNIQKRYTLNRCK